MPAPCGKTLPYNPIHLLLTHHCTKHPVYAFGSYPNKTTIFPSMKRLILLFFLFPLVLFAQSDVSVGYAKAPVGGIGLPGLVPPAAYPSYLEYIALMEGLARRYPDRCALESWGTLPSGRQILTLRLSDSISVNRPRPQVLCTAAMHGDETAGYWLLLRLAEHLLTNDRNHLLADLDLYLNPLANPDGAFRAGNLSLSGATRGNAAGVDLNRNYPDPDDGAHPDGYNYQPETNIFMQAAREHSFDLAINIHGGAEVFNYPWDTYRDRHPDTEWWQRVSRDFASRAQAASNRSGYFNDRRNGITNGHDWYPIAGSRQDYMNYYHRCREATLEVSNRKQFPAEDLPRLWSYVSPALLGFLGEARLGLHGIVTDRATGRPLPARIQIPGHDRTNSDVVADGRYGNFYRYLAAGQYQVLFSAPGYVPMWQNVTVADGQRTDLVVEMERLEATRK